MSNTDQPAAGIVNADGFVNLWPTTLLSRHLPGADAANAAITSLVMQLDQAHSENASSGDMTSNYLEQDFLKQKHPAVEWLVTCINKTVADYLHHTGVKEDLKWEIQAWVNINRSGDYHNLHNHPRSYLSGTYYVAVPTGESLQGRREDLNPNAISFYDPRGQVNMNAVAGDNEFDPEHRIQPSNGQILLWPSFLMHFVHPNLTDETRISISFNIIANRRT